MESTMFGLIGILLPAAAIVGSIIFRTQLRNAIRGEIGAERAQRAAAAAYMMSSGRPGTARVLFAGSGGRMVLVGGQQVLQIALDVQVDGGDSYQASIQQPVGPVQAGALQPGATVAVLVDPANRANVMIDFTKPIRPPATV
jgi:hypothetical protein